MGPEEKRRLFTALQSMGWALRDGELYAPNGTIWLNEQEPLIGDDLDDMLDRMRGRLRRIEGNRTNPYFTDADIDEGERAFADTAGLVDVLEALMT